MKRRGSAWRGPRATRTFVGHFLIEFAQCAAAVVWRSLLFRTTFIAITGSFGKTTAKDCAGAILSLAGPTVITKGSNNRRQGICETILRARPWHRFVVVEVAISGNGRIISFLIRPDVIVILSAGNVSSFATKARSFLCRFSKAIVVLNTDDALLSAVADSTRCKVVRFGFRKDADVRGSNASSRWPRRLQLTVSTAEETRVLYTRLVGTHWATSVLGAIAAAHGCGVGLVLAWKALQEVHPPVGSLQPAPLPGGAMMLRDETNGSAQTLEAALDVMQNASAVRKVLVISDCSDFTANEQQRQRYYAQRAAEIFHSVIFFGEWSHYGLKFALLSGMDPDNVHGFISIEAASHFLRHNLREGDLVLLRGRPFDHLSRIYHAQFGSVECSRPACRRREICDTCPELGAVATTSPSVQDLDLLDLPCWKHEEYQRFARPVSSQLITAASHPSENSVT